MADKFTAEQWEAHQADQKRIKRLQQLLQQAGKGLARRATWEQYETHHHYKQPEVLEAVQAWARGFTPDRGEGLLLWGPVGTGKDHLALAAVRTVLCHHDCSSWWQNGRDLAGEWRDRMDGGETEKGLLATLTRRALLVISDPLPPMGELSNYQADMLYRVVRARTDSGLATICTVNVGSDAEADERMGAPTWDRLTQGAWKIHCDWPTHRTAAKVIE